MATTTLTISTTRLTPLTLWHLLSLDAPTVATLWTIFAARVLHQPLPPTLPITMFVAVWLLYAADRLLDVRTDTRTWPPQLPPLWMPQLRARSQRADPRLTTPSNAANPDLQPRHHFHRTHRTAFTSTLLLAASILLILIPTLPRLLLLSYLLLATLLAAWFALIHLTPLRLPKEFAPGPFFAAAVFLPFHPGLLVPVIFATLCTLNCLYIHVWEHPNPKTHQLLPLFTLALALLPLLHPTSITLATTLAALALLTLNHHRHRLPPTTLRAAADLALLTPLLILPFLQ